MDGLTLSRGFLVLYRWVLFIPRFVTHEFDPLWVLNPQLSTD